MVNIKMFRAEKVLWGEGLFLRPQHFQLQDVYHEQRLSHMIRATFPFAHGIQSIQFDNLMKHSSICTYWH